MMKPLKSKPTEESLDPKPLSEAEAQSMLNFASFYENRTMAQIMIDHDFLPPVPKEHQGDKQWQLDEMALRIQYCKATKIDIVFANKLNKIQNSYSPPADVHSMYFGQKHPQAEFELLESDNTKCKLRCRLRPSMNWIPVSFDIIDAEEQHMIKENSAHWKGNGVQNMLAKNCRIKAENILDRSFVGSTPVEYNPDEILSTQQIEEEIKTEIVSFSPAKPEPNSFEQSVMESTPEPIIESVPDVLEIVDIDEEPKAQPNFKIPTQEEIDQIRTQKISELPPSPDAEPELVDFEDPIEAGYKQEVEDIKAEVQALINEDPTPEQQEDAIVQNFAEAAGAAELYEPQPEPKKKIPKKKSTTVKQAVEKNKLSFLDKEPQKELRKPFGMSQLTITDPKYHTQEIYDLIGDDWFGSFKMNEIKLDLWDDANITIYRSIIKEFNPDLVQKVEELYKTYLDQTPTDRLIVSYHDAVISVDNSLPMNILDTKYLEKMLFVIKILQSFKPTQTEKAAIQEEFFTWFEAKNQGNNREALWAYNYMQARGFL